MLPWDIRWVIRTYFLSLSFSRAHTHTDEEIHFSFANSVSAVSINSEWTYLRNFIHHFRFALQFPYGPALLLLFQQTNDWSCWQREHANALNVWSTNEWVGWQKIFSTNNLSLMSKSILCTANTLPPSLSRTLYIQTAIRICEHFVLVFGDFSLFFSFSLFLISSRCSIKSFPRYFLRRFFCHRLFPPNKFVLWFLSVFYSSIFSVLLVALSFPFYFVIFFLSCSSSHFHTSNFVSRNILSETLLFIKERRSRREGNEDINSSNLFCVVLYRHNRRKDKKSVSAEGSV